MTEPASTPRTAATPAAAAPPRLVRAGLAYAALLVPLLILALFSLLTPRGFAAWIDAAAVPPPVTAGVCLAWAVGTLGLGLAPLRRWRLTAWLLALPALPMLALLGLDVWRFYTVVFPAHLDTWALPAALPVGLLLLAWLLIHLRGGVRPARLPVGWAVFLLAWIGLNMYIWCLLFSLHDRPPAAGAPPADAAIVFGHGMYADGAAGPTLAARTERALALFHAGQVRTLVLSGAIDPSPDGAERSEATAMATLCRAAGVPEGALVLDPVGVNTRATVANVRRLATANGWTHLVAVSSDYHLPRIELAFAQAGLHVYTASAAPALWGPTHFGALLREAAGLPVYWLLPYYRPAVVDQMALTQPRLVAHKAARTLELFDGPRLVKTYHCLTGSVPGNKQVEGDRKTPEGTFHVCYKNPESNFHLSLGLDYPNLADAQRGLAAGLISQAQHDQIVAAIGSGGIPNWYTRLGGEIFIHGEGDQRDPNKGSAGCIVISNAQIEELYAVCPVGTEVVVTP